MRVKTVYNVVDLGGGIIVKKTKELLERLKNYKPETKAPPDYNRMVEYFPNAFGSLDRLKAKEKQEAAEKAKA